VLGVGRKASLLVLENKKFKDISNLYYRYTYEILNYSDGSHGFGDYNDWGKMDLTFFQPDGAD
jgi:hypothetical protein